MRIFLTLIGVGLLASSARGHSLLGSTQTVGATDSPALTIPTSDTSFQAIAPLVDSWLGNLSNTGSPLAQGSPTSLDGTLGELGKVNGNWPFASDVSNGPGPSALLSLISAAGPTGTSVALSSEGPWVAKPEYVALVALPAPEPSGIALTASGLAALVFWRLRRA